MSAENPVIEHLRAVARKYAIAAGVILALAAFFAWRLRGSVGAGAPAVGLVAFALAPLLALVGLGWALFLVRSPLSHPTLRALERRSPGATRRVLEALAGAQFVIRHGPLAVTREAALVLAPWGLEARFMDDLAWVHPTFTTVALDGVVVQKYLSITLRFLRAPPLGLVVSPADLEALTAMLSDHWPKVVVGWSKEREELWRRDRAHFLERAGATTASRSERQDA